MPFMLARKIGLVHPAFDAVRSGGSLYNERLLGEAARCGFPLLSLPWREAPPVRAGCDLLVWDSLLLDRVQRIAAERIAVLLHYLPSGDPCSAPCTRLAALGAEDRALAAADLVIATGRSLARLVATRCPATPVFVCEPGVSREFLRRPSRPPHRRVSILTVAHLLPAKGHERLLEMLLQMSDLPWRWHLAGDCGRTPDIANRLLERAAAAGLTERIRLHGRMPHAALAALMADCDLLVAPSTFEAYGMSVGEAVAAGLPVLSNRVGAAEHLVRHGETGYLAALGDWDAFARHLRELLENAALRAAFRDNLRHADVRGWNQTLTEFRSACEQVLE